MAPDTPGPSVPGGAADAIGRALSNAPDQARAALTRVRDRLRDVVRDGLDVAREGAGSVLDQVREFGGEGVASIVTPKTVSTALDVLGGII